MARGGALLAASAVPVAQALWLRLGIGALHAPAGLALALAAGHLLGLLACLRAARRGTLPGTAASWAVSAALALAFTALIAQELELRARLAAADLRFEAGRIAWRLLEPVPAPERDAWPVYRRLDGAWFEDDAAAERMRALRADRERLGAGEELDFQDPQRRARMDRLAGDLADVRAAARLPGCDFGARHGPMSAANATSFGESTLIVLYIADALALEASLRLASDDVDGALDDLEALGGLVRHALGSPVLGDLMMGTVLAEQAADWCALLLERADIDAPRLARISAALPGSLGASSIRALEMEEAWALSALGLVVGGDALAGGLDLSLSRIETALFLIFLLEGDVRGYRASMAELRSLARADLATLRAEAEIDDDVLRARHASRGTMTLLAMGKFASQLLHVRRVDARLALAHKALADLQRDPAAARAQGRWVDPDPAWGDDPPQFVLRP